MSVVDVSFAIMRVERARIARLREHEAAAVLAERRRVDDQRVFRQRMRIGVFGDLGGAPAAARDGDDGHQRDTEQSD